MKKGLLLCSGGMSTTMIAKKLNSLMDGEMKWTAKGVAGSSEYQDTLDEYDFVFVSPQIRFMYDEICESASEHNIPCEQIAPQNYIVTNADKLVDIVKKHI